jgi:TolB-like protein
MTEPSRAVFLSYASQNSAAAVRIAAALRAAGVEVWLDTTELRGGDAWDRRIQGQIKACALFIAVISRATLARDEGYFRLEWKLAIERTRLLSDERVFLLPVAIDDVTETERGVPEAFRHVQWTRLPNGETPHAFTKQVRALLTSMGTNSDIPRTGPPQSSGTPRVQTLNADPRVGRKAPAALIAAIAFAALAIAAGIWQHFRTEVPTNRPATIIAASSPVSTTANTAESVAVLPFVNESSDKEQDYFADGLTETMIDLLSKVPDLHVPARHASFYFKGRNDDLAVIATKLHVTNLLEGTVRKAGNKLRISAELIRADTGYQAWSETYDREMKDVFKVQDEISAAVVGALKLRLVDAATNTRTRGTSNVEAYNQYLLGKHYEETGGITAERYRHVASFYRKAITLDPGYADAAAKVVMSEAFIADLTGDAQGLKREINAAEHLPVDHPNHGPSYRIRGLVRGTWEWDWEGAEVDFAKALSLDPTDDDAFSDWSVILSGLGRFTDAIEKMQKAVALDSLDVLYLSDLATLQIAARQYELADQTLHRVAEIDPKSDIYLQNLSTLRLLQGRFAESLATCPNISEERLRLMCIAEAQFSLGNRAEAKQAFGSLVKTGTGGNLSNLAAVCGWFGEVNCAFSWYDKAAAAREQAVTQILADRTQDALHKDPRWAVLLQKMKLPPDIIG